MDMSNLKPINMEDFRKANSKTLYRSICVPSATQSYSICVEYMKKWFLSKFPPNTFKSIYVDGKNIYDEFRSLSKIELLKKEKPALAIVPSLDWDFDNDNLDSYPYGLDLYVQTGRFKNSFFKCPETNSYMGIGMETLLMPFTFRIRVETRAQQIDLYKFIKLACRVGYSNGEDVDLDFHIPYALMIQLARDNGFEVVSKTFGDDPNPVETIKEVPKFLRWLNTHSTIPFLYKYRALNGRNEFFIRMRDMYVHIKPTGMSADDGEREGQMTNNFVIEFSADVRFPAPKMYAYYSNNEHNLKQVYGAWYQPNGPISTVYTFKGNIIPDSNKYGWPLYMSTTYEEDDDAIDKRLEVDISELLQGDIGDCIKDCLYKGISPSIFCDTIFYNGGEYIDGVFDWSDLKFVSNNPVRSAGTFIGIYIDNDYLSNYILEKSGYDDRLKKSDKTNGKNKKANEN